MRALGQRIKWAIVRIIYYILLALAALTGGMAIYLFAPITSYYFFGDFLFWKHIKYFHLLNTQMYRIIYFWLSDPKYRSMYTQPLAAPPMKSPDRTKIKISRKWEYGENDCAGCVKCCVKIKCPMLDSAGNKCLIYNSPYWNYFSCGRYPVSQGQIDYYDCDKWEMKDCDPKEYPVREKTGLTIYR